MHILKYSNFYEKMKALKVCEMAKLYKEQAYLNIIIGEKEKAV